MSLNLLFLTKLFPRKDIIGGPILIYHRIKNLSFLGHKITLISPVYTEQDLMDKSLENFCEKIFQIKSVRKRPPNEVERLYKRLKRPRFFLTGDGGYNQEIEDVFKLSLEKNHFDAVIAEYSVMGQYIEANFDIIPKDTMSIISVHECYTKSFELRAKKTEAISEDTIKELFYYEFEMYKTTDKILTLTKEDAEILVSYLPDLKDKIRVVPHGVDTKFFTPPKDKFQKRITKNILYIGNFQHYPNVDAVKNFIKHCWNRILKDVPDAKFYAIGFNPPQELLDLRGENVIVQQGGDNENIKRFYWQSDIFVAPIELGSGFRGKILEALSCGLPVVATPRAVFGINPAHKKDMFVASDYDAFSKYVIMLLKDYNFRKRISMNALKLAKKFDHKNAAKKLEQVLKESKR